MDTASARHPVGESLSAPVRDLTIAAEDGYLLGATLHEPAAGASSGPITVIAPAAAVPARYYAKFAAFLAEHGRPVLRFDYRGIGASRRGSLRGFEARMRDWCVRDVPGVIAWAARTYPDRPLHWVGHSMGGFAAGLAHNNAAIARQLNIATLSGYWGRMATPERYRVLVLMGHVAPVLVRLIGYLPGRLIGGEDMPGPAFLEWSRWCMTPEFLFGDETLAERANFPHLRAPVRFAQIEDDVWGTPAAVDHIAGYFTGAAERSIWRVRLADAGATRIGHLGFFREAFRDTLWRQAADWLDAVPAQPA
jgi:predicted alpha/beta hydrolase